MSTTTIRIEGDLKARIATAAERAGKSAHAFIVEAISQKVDQMEAEEELQQLAQKRWAKVLQRELLIGRHSRAYVALYRFVPDIDTVVVLALRSQRESGFKRPT